VRISVLGAGNGGYAAASDLALRGFQVTLYEGYDVSRLKPIQEQGGIQMTGPYKEEFVKIKDMTTDPKQASENADVFLVAVPAFGQRWLAEAFAKHLRKGQLWLMTPGSAGSLELHNSVFTSMLKKGILLAETNILPYGCRITKPGTIWTRPYKVLLISGFPSTSTDTVLEEIGDIYSFKRAKNVLESALTFTNPIIHSIPGLLNTGPCELNKPEFVFYEDSMTSQVLRCMDAVDQERQKVCRALDFDSRSMDDLYREFHVAGPVYRSRGKGLPGGMLDRYITEDVPYGLVLWASLGDLARIETLLIDSFIRIGSTVRNTDFMANGRNLKRLGIEGFSKERLLTYLQNAS